MESKENKAMAIVRVVEDININYNLFNCEDIERIFNYHPILDRLQKDVVIYEHHSSIFSHLDEEGVFGYDHAALKNVVVMIGIMCIADYYKIHTEVTQNILDRIKVNCSHKLESEDKELKKALNGLNKIVDVKNCDEVTNILEWYSNNKYVDYAYYLLYKKSPNKNNVKELLSENIINRCRELLSKDLTTSIFKIKKEKNNKEYRINLPEEFFILAKLIKQRIFKSELMGEILRLCFAAGLYLLANIIVNSIEKPTGSSLYKAISSLKLLHVGLSKTLKA